MNADQFAATYGGLPQTNPQLNYASTEVNLTEAVNEEIDRNKKDLEKHYNHLADIYNQQYKNEANRFSQIVDFARKGKELGVKLDTINKYQKDYKKATNKYKVPWAISGVVNPDLTDPDVIKYQEYKDAKAINQGDRVWAAHDAESKGDLDSRIVLDPSLVDLEELVRGERLGHVKDNWETVFPLLQNKLKLNFTKSHGELNEFGEQDLRAARTATTRKEKIFAYGSILSFYLAANEDLAEGRAGEYKRDVRYPLLKDLDARLNIDYEEDRKAATATAIEHEKSSLISGIKKDPQHLIRHLEVYKNRYPDQSYRSIRMDTYRNLADFAEAGVLSRSEANTISDMEFPAHDHTPKNPHMVTARDYWKSETKMLMGAVQKFERAEFEAEKADQEAMQQGVAAELVKEYNKSEVQTAAARNDLVTEFMSKTGVTDPRYIPSILKNLQYEGLQDDIDLEKELLNKYNKGIRINKSDVAKFGDPDLKAKWSDKVGKGDLQGEEKSFRDKFIRASVNEKTNETIGTDDTGSLEWQAYYRNASLAFNRAYVASREVGNSHMDAMKDGRDAVTAGLADERWSTYQGSGQDLNKVTSVIQAKDALSKDPTLINNPNYLPGEKIVLDKVLKTWNPENPEVPYFYNQIASNIKDHDGYSVMLSRMKILNLLKEDKPVIPAQENLKQSQARLLSNKPNFSRTYRVTQDNTDYLWMLEQVQDPTALNNGGYDAVVDQNGEYSELEKPLSQHTLTEVLGLIREGYEDFGAYGLTATGFLDVVESSNIPLDKPFDQNTQDLLILGRLRQKAAQSQQYTTINNQYRRLVNIALEDEDEFLRIVGDIPPYLRLSNLLPAVATEMVNQTLQ